MLKIQYKETISHRLAGIPCLIGVRMCKKYPPNPKADNPDDYYGYCDVDYDILDSKGKPAAWLEKKATKSDHDDIFNRVVEVFTGDEL